MIDDVVFVIIPDTPSVPFVLSTRHCSVKVKKFASKHYVVKRIGRIEITLQTNI